MQLDNLTARSKKFIALYERQFAESEKFYFYDNYPNVNIIKAKMFENKAIKTQKAIDNIVEKMTELEKYSIELYLQVAIFED